MSSTLQYYGRLFEDSMVKGFYKYGLIVGKNPKYFIWGSVIFTLLCVPGLFFLKINLDLYRLFVPLDAPVRTEFERTQEFNRLPGGDLTIGERKRRFSEIDYLNPQSLRWETEEEYTQVLKRIQRAVDFEDLSLLHLSNITESATRRLRRDTPEKRKKQQPPHVKKNNTPPPPAANVPLKHDILRFYVVHENFDNLLDSKYLGLLWNLTNEMMNVKAVSDGEEYTFDTFCRKAAQEKTCNNQLNVWLKHADVLFKDGKIRNNPNLQLSYPVMYLFNRPKDIGNVIYGVNVTGDKNEITGARVLTIHWFITFPNTPKINTAYMDYREQLNEFWRSKQEGTGITFIAHNERAMDDEMLKIIQTTVPFAFPSTVMLMGFVIFANWSKVKSKSKPMEMWLGVIAVCMALIQTFGIFFICGAQFNPVTSTMPFLVLAVGVDDDFLMMGAWRELDKKISVPRRIALVMGDAGASVTVTSITNFFCFALGYLMCSTPAVAEFCLITAFGVLLDYIMQITFFAGVITLSGHKEEEGGLAACCYKKTDGDPPAIESGDKKSNDDSVDSDSIDPNHHAKAEDLPYMHTFFRDKFAPLVVRNDVKLVSWAVFALYAAVSFYGCCTLMVDISPVKYIRDNSPIQTFVKLADKFIWADNVMPSFHVMRPPDLRDPGLRAKFNEMVFRLEHTNYSVGRVSTNLWIWQYQQYLNDFPNIDYKTDFYSRKHMRNFFNQLDFQQYRDKVKIFDNVTDGEPCISAFTFQTSFYGLDSWDKRQAELFHWRAIINEYPEFDMFLSGIFSPFLIDQRRTIAPSSMQTIGCALTVMSLISFFFLPDMQSVFLMTFSLLSISMGVCGGLAILGSDLDSVSMGCIVMAIGLAVDYSVHICYRYHRSEERRANGKVKDTLASVGWPICQAVGSTLCGLASLVFVPAYLVRVFFQTVYLVNVIGIAHGLVWLPQLISSLDPCERVPLRNRVHGTKR